MRRPIARSVAVTAGTLLAPRAAFRSEAQSTVIPTRMELLSSANPSRASQALTLTARVYPVTPSSGAPTGAVHFFDGNTLLGNAPLAEVDGVPAASLRSPTSDPGLIS